MDWYGLGIALQFRDNATSGITRATQNLTNLSNSAKNMASTTTQALSDVEKQMRTFETIQMSGYFVQNIGDSIASVGKSMLDPLISVASQVTNTGAQFENYRLTLKALYGDAEVAIAKTNEAMQLAANTPFQIGDVMNSVIGFKAIGVEALDTMEHLTGESRTLLEYIGDLASLRPDIGLDGMLYGIRNLLGGDGGRSLRSRLDMDFEQMLGFEWADTTEGIIEQIVYASQQVANGLMKEMEGSWQHMTSNIKDQWDRFKLAISDAGFFDGVKGTLRYFYEMIDSIDEEKMARIGKNISDAFNMIWKPIDFVARKLTDFFGFIVDLVETNPLIAKFVTGFISLAGALTVVSGTVIALGGAFLVLIGGLNLFAMQIRLLPSTLSMLAGGLKSALLFMGKFALIGGTLYALWKTDFAGIRTILSNFMQNVYTAFKKSSEIASMGATEMINSLEALDTTTFGGWLTYQLVRLQVLWMALVECWNTNELSDETFQKVQYLGLLPLISFILDCKARFEAFVDGFIRGWQKISDFVVPIVEWLGEQLFKVLDFLFPIEKGTSDMNTEFGGINVARWEQLGEATAYVVTMLAGLFAVGKVVSVITGIGTTVWNLVTGIIGGFSTVMSFLKNVVLMPILSGVGTVVTAILGACGIIISAPAWVVGAITLAVIALVAFIIVKWDEIKEFTLNLCEKIGEFFTDLWDKVCDIFSNAWDWIVTNVWEPIKPYVEGICQIIVGLFQIAWGLITGIVELAWNLIKAIVYTGIEIIKAIVTPIVEFFNMIWQGICNIATVVWNAIVDFLKWAYDEITTRWNNMINFFQDLWNGIYNNIIVPIWEGIKSFIKTAYDVVVNIWNGAKEVFSNIWNAIKTVAEPVWNGIKTLATEVYDGVVSVWDSLTGVFSKIWDNIKSTASTFFNWLGEKFSWVSSIIDGVTNAFNNIKSGVSNGLNNVVSGAKKLVGLNTGGYVKTEGVAMLHPNEVVVNDVLTQKLRNFLDGQEQKPESYETGKPEPSYYYNSGVDTNSVQGRSTNNVTNDNSVTFNQGAIVIQYSATGNGSDSDARELAQQVMKYIQKETKLRKSLNYAK